MPRKLYPKELLLHMTYHIALYCSQHHHTHPSVSVLMKDQCLLVKLISELDMTFDAWNIILERIVTSADIPSGYPEMTTKLLYHYFNETLKAKVSDPISDRDSDYIYARLQHAISNNIPLTREFQDSIKKKLTRPYNRTRFTVKFNNLKRNIMMKLAKAPELDHRIHRAKNNSMPDLREISVAQSAHGKERDSIWLSSEKLAVSSVPESVKHASGSFDYDTSRTASFESWNIGADLMSLSIMPMRDEAFRSIYDGGMGSCNGSFDLCRMESIEGTTRGMGSGQWCSHNTSEMCILPRDIDLSSSNDPPIQLCLPENVSIMNLDSVRITSTDLECLDALQKDLCQPK